MNNLIFDCAELMSIDRTFQYLGDSFDYRHVDKMSVKGRITGNYSLNRIQDVWVGQSGFINYQTGNNVIYLNNISMGTGRLVSLNFDKSTDVLEKKYSASFEILRDSKILLEATGNYYDDISGFSRFKLLNNFAESQNFSQESENKYVFEKSLSFSLDSLYKEFYSGSATNLAKEIASGFFSHSNIIPMIDVQYPDFSINLNDSNRTVKESYDIIKNEFSFSERFDYQSGLPYVWGYKNSISSSSDGITTIAEEGSVKSSKVLSSSLNKIDYANSGWAIVQTGIYGRVYDTYQVYSEFLPTRGCSLAEWPTSKSISKDKFNGIIDYNYVYTNDPNLHSGFVYEYEDSIAHLKGGYSEFSQNGVIYSLNPNRASGFAYIKSVFDSTITSDVASRSSGIYGRYLKLVDSGCYDSGKLELVNSQITYKKFDSRIEFAYVKSDDPSIVNSGNIFSVKTSVSDNKPVHIVGNFPIPNYKVLVQESSQSTIGNYVNSFSVVGKTGASLNDLLQSCYSRATKPDGECWIADFGYTYNEFEKKLDMSLSYNYSQYRAFNNINI